MTQEVCKNCRFWTSFFDELEFKNGELPEPEEREMRSFGRCRRFPPVAVVHDGDVDGFRLFEGNATDFFEFVYVPVYETCGEWKLRDVRH